MSEAALHFEQVTRRFGKKTAVDRLDLKVEPGSILGLVGRNGSGKTTSLCLAYGLLYADEGSIRVLGLDPQRDGLELRTRVSLLAEESSLYPWMTVREILDFGAAMHPNWDAQLAADVCDRLNLGTNEHRFLQVLDRGLEPFLSLVRRARAIFENGAPDAIQLDGKIDAQVDGRVLTVVAEDPGRDLERRLRSLGASEVEVEAISLEDILIAFLRSEVGSEVAHV